MENEVKVLSANVFQLLDSNGKVRALLSPTNEGVGLIISNAEGKEQIKLSADDNGAASLKLYDNTGEEKIELSVDDQGTHIHLAGAGKQETYLFLKKSGASGLVLTDKDGIRRMDVKIGPDAQPDIAIYPLTGEPKHF